MPDSDSPHFICGMSRTGITPLTRCLNLHPDVAAFGQSRFWGRYWIEPEGPDGGYSSAQRVALRDTLVGFTWTGTVGPGPGTLDLDLAGFRALVAAGMDATDPGAGPDALFGGIAQRLREREGARFVFEKTPHHIHCVDRILRYFPKAHFVVIRAEPRLFFRMHRSQPDLQYHPLVAGFVWRSYDRAHASVLARHPERVVTVQLEELISDPEAALGPTLEHFDLPPADLAAPVRWARDLPPPAELDAADELIAALLSDGPFVLDRPTLRSLAGAGVRLPRFALAMGWGFQREHAGRLDEYLGRWLR